MIQTILFATDLCVFTPYLVQHVVNMAEGCGAKVIVVHAVEPLGSLGTAVVNTYLPAKASAELREQGMGAMLSSIKDHLIERLADEFIDNEIHFNHIRDVIVEEGKPAEVILKYAKERQADLIIMGTHSPDLLQGASLGSTTAKVLQLSRIPVFTIPVLPNAPAQMPSARQGSLF